MKIAIAIPARYASSRFPGKPLAMIAGKTMLARVADIAREAAAMFESLPHMDVTVFITTDDARIEKHAAEIGLPCFMTSQSCKTGSDRVLEALRQMQEWPDFVINLQGDAPFTPVATIRALIQAFIDDATLEAVTPVHRLSWNDLDRLREAKKTTPFSGTTAILDSKRGEAIWFSKAILPVIRKEDDLRAESPMSPVYQHMGLYGYRIDVLEKFCRLPQSPYEKIEELEQLRLIENGIAIRAVEIEIEDGGIHSGIDTPEDLKRAEALLYKRDAKAS